MRTLSLSMLLLALCVPHAASADIVDELLEQYRAEGAGEFSAEAGQRLWHAQHSHGTAPNSRSCVSCHTSDPHSIGEHVRTGKSIKPMARSMNFERYTEQEKVEKWFKRNCKWTLGRECSAQEKGDLLVFLRSH